MPIFEFLCQECGSPFEELLRSASKIDEVTCPECGSTKVIKQISIFASQSAGSSSGFSTTSAGSCSTGSL